MRWNVKPTSLAPLRIVQPNGFGPRHCGRSDGWPFTIPNRGTASTSASSFQAQPEHSARSGSYERKSGTIRSFEPTTTASIPSGVVATVSRTICGRRLFLSVRTPTVSCPSASRICRYPSTALAACEKIKMRIEAFSSKERAERLDQRVEVVLVVVALERDAQCRRPAPIPPEHFDFPFVQEPPFQVFRIDR